MSDLKDALGKMAVKSDMTAGGSRGTGCMADTAGQKSVY